MFSVHGDVLDRTKPAGIDLLQKRMSDFHRTQPVDYLVLEITFGSPCLNLDLPASPRLHTH